MKTQESKKVDLRPVVINSTEFKNGYTVYTVQSNSDPEQMYTVTFQGDRLVSCTCVGYRNYAHCYHSDRLQEREHTPEATQDELPIEQKGALHSSRPFSLMR